MGRLKTKLKNRNHNQIKLTLSHATLLHLAKALKKIENKKPTEIFVKVMLKQCKYILDGYYKNPDAQKFNYKDIPDEVFEATGHVNPFKTGKKGVASDGNSQDGIN